MVMQFITIGVDMAMGVNMTLFTSIQPRVFEAVQGVRGLGQKVPVVRYDDMRLS